MNKRNTLYPYHGEQLPIPEIAARRKCSVETIRRFIRQHGPEGVYRPLGDARSGARMTAARIKAMGSSHPFNRRALPKRRVAA
jgi:hypothetical protein